jgi:hypothetical protein
MDDVEKLHFSLFKTPTVPNFILLTNGSSIPIADVPDHMLRLLAAKWAIELIKLARSRRKPRKAKLVKV